MQNRTFYNEILTEHNIHPIHKTKMINPQKSLRGVNPSCGDDITLQLKIVDGVIEDAMFSGSGCAISQASVDMMADQVIGRTKEDAIKLAGTFMGMIKGEIKDEEELEELDEAAALQDISHMPARVKCAVLGWKTMQKMLEHPEDAENISSEND